MNGVKNSLGFYERIGYCGFRMIRKISHKLRVLFKSKVFIGVFLILLLGGLFRACNGPIMDVIANTYYIVRGKEWAPLELFGKEPNMGAFIDELMFDVASLEKLRIHINVSPDTNSLALFHLIDTGEYDAMIAIFTPNAFMKEKYLISEPIYNAGPVLVVRFSSVATSIADLQSKPIGVKSGSSQVFDLGKESSLFVSYDNLISALEDLQQGVIDGVIMDAELAEIYMKGFYKDKLRIATAPLTDLGIRLVAHKSKKNQELIDKFNKGLATTESNGVFESLIERWGLTNP